MKKTISGLESEITRLTRELAGAKNKIYILEADMRSAQAGATKAILELAHSQRDAALEASALKDKIIEAMRSVSYTPVMAEPR